MLRAVFLLIALGTMAQAQSIEAVQLIEPTVRYGHHPMGPQVADHGALRLQLSDGSQQVIRLPLSRVFEDNAARLVDVSPQAGREVVVVEADETRGARLSVYGVGGLITASPFIGRRNRWMAVAGIADLDGDGQVEFAVVDRPHLRRTLVVWRQEGARLVAVAELPGVTNHRFGEAGIIGGLRDCGAGPEVIVARADWTGLLAARLVEDRLVARDLGDGAGAARVQDALACAL